MTPKEWAASQRRIAKAETKSWKKFTWVLWNSMEKKEQTDWNDFFQKSRNKIPCASYNTYIRKCYILDVMIKNGNSLWSSLAQAWDL